MRVIMPRSSIDFQAQRQLVEANTAINGKKRTANMNGARVKRNLTFNKKSPSFCSIVDKFM